MIEQFYCEICGGLFNRSVRGNRKMWCDDCKPLAEKLYQAEYYKRRKGEIDQLRAALAAKGAEITELKEKNEREIERIKKNHGCARQQGTTQFCHEALDAHKEADAMRADAALGAAVRRMPPDHKLFNGNELGWFVDNGNDRFAGEGDTPEAAMIAAGLMKGEER